MEIPVIYDDTIMFEHLCLLAEGQSQLLGLDGLVMGVYCTLLVIVASFGFHRWQMLYLYYKHKKNASKYKSCFRELPTVTIQLPMYNELYVAQRVIASVCRLNYPKDKLQIQVLDDSTDETRQIAASTVARFAAKGFDIEYMHRTHRVGYKAGALAEGLQSAKGEFIAVYDADFIPTPDNLMASIHYFTDPSVGMVQFRWEHINREQSFLTRVQAVFLDAHFMIEHAARNFSGRFMNFNGTAGLWRKTAIEEAGSWEHDTLTEDLDLSYRCQMKGWRFVYLPHVTSPAELPPEIQGFKQQQFRWTKGSVQTAKKILPKLLKEKLPLRIKIEACFHLLNPVGYLFMSLLVLMFLPISFVRFSYYGDHVLAPIVWGVFFFMIATCSVGTFYMASQKEIFHRWTDKVKYMPLLMAVGVGIAINNSLAVIEAFIGKESPFERTPKFGMGSTGNKDDWMPKAKSFCRKKTIMPIVELMYGFYVTICIIVYLKNPSAWILLLPFLVIFATGYFYVACLTLYGTKVSEAREEEFQEVLKSSAA